MWGRQATGGRGYAWVRSSMCGRWWVVFFTMGLWATVGCFSRRGWVVLLNVGLWATVGRVFRFGFADIFGDESVFRFEYFGAWVFVGVFLDGATIGGCFGGVVMG